jgi:hypothetical protein
VELVMRTSFLLVVGDGGFDVEALAKFWSV